MSDFFPPPPEHGAIDPLRAVADQARNLPPKRFYRLAEPAPRAEGYVVQLDGRVLKTPAKTDLLLPDARLAALVAAEWAGQGETIDPAAMPLTRLANSALCGVSAQMAATLAEVTAYAGSDLLCYRAGEPAALASLQARHWDPTLAWARDALGARFVLVEGVMPAPQPPLALERVAKAAESLVGAGAHAPFRLAALNVMTVLTGSALLALHVAAGELSGEAAWSAAYVDEDFEISLWGAYEEAMKRRAGRRRDFDAAVVVFTRDC